MKPIGSIVLVRRNIDNGISHSSRLQHNPRIAELCAEAWRKLYTPDLWHVDVREVYIEDVAIRNDFGEK